jgi:hypothetical protein
LLFVAAANLDMQRYRRGMPTNGSQFRAGRVIGGLRHLSTSYGRSLAGAPPGQTVLQQPDNFLSSMTIAFMVLDEVDAAISRQ